MPGRIPDEIVERVREYFDIVDVIADYVELKKVGNNYMGLCPFHNEKTPSFSVSPDKQIFYCFGCHKGGNVFKFLMEYDGISFPEAVEMLADRAGIKIPREEMDEQARTRQKLKEELYAVNELAARFYSRCLGSELGANALQYLKSRGVDDDTIEHFRIGYAPDNWGRVRDGLKDRGFSPDLGVKAGLLGKKVQQDSVHYFDMFRNRVMFPIINRYDQVLGFGGRIIGDEGPKYLNTRETMIFNKGRNLYALNLAYQEIRRQDVVIIVEGYMDAIALHQYGVKNTVATLGTSLTSDQVRMLKSFTRNVLVCYDADAAGQTATVRGLEMLSQAGANVKVIRLPAGMDPDDYVRQEGTDAFSQLVSEAVPLPEYRLQVLIEAYGMETTEAKLNIIRKYLPVLARMNNAVEQEEYARKAAAILNVSLSAVHRELGKLTEKGKKRNYRKDITAKKRNNTTDNSKHILPIHERAERELLAMMINFEEVKSYVRERVSPEDFSPKLRELAQMILIQGLRLDSILDRIQDKQTQDELLRLTAQVTNYDKLEEEAADCIRRMKERRIKEKLEELQKEIRLIRDNDTKTARKLLQEIAAYQRELKSG